MEQEKLKKIGIGWTNFTAVAMETKKGGFKKNLDSFYQTSWSFVGITTVVCGSFWGWKKFKMAAVAMVAKVQNMLNGNRTEDPFENRSSLKVVVFGFLNFQNGHQYKNEKNKNKLLKIQKWKDFNGNWYLQGVRHAAPYRDHFGLLWRPFWIQNGHQNT